MLRSMIERLFELEAAVTIRVERQPVAEPIVEPSAPAEKWESAPLPGVLGEATERTSKMGRKYQRHAESLAMQLGPPGIDALAGDQVIQWYAHVTWAEEHQQAVRDRFVYNDVNTDWDGLDAETIERLVSKEVAPVYGGELEPDFDLIELLHDPELFSDEARLRIEALSAARREAVLARPRAKLAVAKLRCLRDHPGWRQRLWERYSELPPA